MRNEPDDEEKSENRRTSATGASGPVRREVVSLLEERQRVLDNVFAVFARNVGGATIQDIVDQGTIDKLIIADLIMSLSVVWDAADTLAE